MSADSKWVRMTLRLPSDLHRRIIRQRGEGSLNAAIVEALDSAYPPDRPLNELYERLHFFRTSLDGYDLNEIDLDPWAKIVLQELDEIERQLREAKDARDASTTAPEPNKKTTS